jgi:hypothetical protein
MPTKSRRSDLKREEDILNMVEMHVQNRPLHEIAAKFNISKRQVKRDLRSFYEGTKNDRDQKKRARRDRLLTEIGLAKRELWEAWHLSKKDKEVQTKERTSTEGGGEGSQNGGVERTRASIRSEGCLPHCPYMAELGKCWEKEARLMGVNDPDKVEDEVVKPIQIIPIRHGQPRQDDAPAQTTPEAPPSVTEQEEQVVVAATTTVTTAATPIKKKAGFKIIAKPLPPDPGQMRASDGRTE